MQSFKKRKSAAEDGMLWKQRLKAKQASMKPPLGHTQVSTKTCKGNTQPLKHAAEISSGPQPSSQHSAQGSGKPAGHLLKPNKRKKKASPQQEQVC